MSELLKVYDDLPEGFLIAEGPHLAELLGGPSLIRLPGRRAKPLFVSLMLHGNEITGLQAVQALLRRYRGRALPRSVVLFVGNVEAAISGMRRLPEQPDYNRIWPTATGAPAVAPCAETDMAASVFEAVAAQQPFAAVDVHNNSGRNPHYACVNALRPQYLQLARRFSHNVLYFTHPAGTLSAAFAQLGPSVTLECGPIGERSGASHAAEFLEDCLHLPAIPRQRPDDREIALYASVARVTVPEAISVAVGEARAQLHLPGDLEDYNWRDLPAGTVLARVDDVPGDVLEVRDALGRDRAEAFLRRDGDRLVAARPLTPAMLTTNVRIIRQDCLCYFLERMSLSEVAFE